MSLGALGTQGRLYKSFRRLWGDLVSFPHTQVLSVPGSWLVVSSFPFPLVVDVLNRIPACNGARWDDLRCCVVAGAVFGVSGCARYQRMALRRFPAVGGLFLGYPHPQVLVTIGNALLVVPFPSPPWALASKIRFRCAAVHAGTIYGVPRWRVQPLLHLGAQGA